MEKMRRDTIYLDAMLFDVLQLAGSWTGDSLDVEAMLRCASLQQKKPQQSCAMCDDFTEFIFFIIPSRLEACVHQNFFKGAEHLLAQMKVPSRAAMR